MNSTSYKDVVFEEPILKPGKPTKASDKEFRQIYRQARDVADSMGDSYNWSLQDFRDDTDPDWSKNYSIQTLKGIQQRINSEKTQIANSVKFGLITQKEALTRTRALSALQRTLNRTVKNQRSN